MKFSEDVTTDFTDRTDMDEPQKRWGSLVRLLANAKSLKTALLDDRQIRPLPSDLSLPSSV